MTTTAESKSSEPMLLDHILESAVVINWSDLVRGAIPGLIHVEYHVGDGRLIEDVRIWSSTARGYWSLVCHCSIDLNLVEHAAGHVQNQHLHMTQGEKLSAKIVFQPAGSCDHQAGALAQRHNLPLFAHADNDQCGGSSLTSAEIFVLLMYLHYPVPSTSEMVTRMCDFGNLLSAIMKRQGEFLRKRVASANHLLQVGPPEC